VELKMEELAIWLNHLKLLKSPECRLEVYIAPRPGTPRVLKGGGLLEVTKYAVCRLIDDDHPAVPDWIEEKAALRIKSYLDDLSATDPTGCITDDAKWQYARARDALVDADWTVFTSVEQKLLRIG